MMRNKLFMYLANNEKTLFPFFKDVYFLTLGHETIKRKLFHKYDIKIVESINYIEFLKKINRFFSTYDPLKVEFNQYVYGKYD